MKINRLPCRLPKTKTPRQKYLAHRRNDKITTIVLQIGLLFALIGIWELAARLDWIDPFITSCPSRIVSVLGTIDVGELFTHIAYTLIECIIGFIAASGLGILIAVLLWRFVKLRRVVEPYIVVLNALPKIALGPIIIIWVGAGAQAIIVMTILICIIVTVISVLSAFMAVDEGKILLMRSMGATKLQILFKLILPANIPALVNMLKINVGLAWVGTIMGEYLVSTAGLGYLIIYGSQVFKMDLVMASTVILCVLATVMYLAVAGVEKLTKKKYKID
ncbi:MAG: ABC transporter permease [Clostridiales bacterium]|nr:ABC transporter permease [Clostridiales bacterium]